MTNIPRIFRHCAKHSMRSIPVRLHSEPKGKYFSLGWTISGAHAAGKAREANRSAPMGNRQLNPILNSVEPNTA